MAEIPSGTTGPDATADPFGGHEFHYEGHTDLFRCIRCHRYEVAVREGGHDRAVHGRAPGRVPDRGEHILSAARMITAVRPLIHCPASRFPRAGLSRPRGCCLVREEDAAALVADAVVALGQRGKRPVVTAENGPRLVRLGALMLAEFGVADREEDDDG